MSELKTLLLGAGPMELRLTTPVMEAIKGRLLLADGHLQRVNLLAPGDSLPPDFVRSRNFKKLCAFISSFLHVDCFDRVIVESAIVRDGFVLPTTVRLSLKIGNHDESE